MKISKDGVAVGDDMVVGDVDVEELVVSETPS
jgi:hypothetical protein